MPYLKILLLIPFTEFLLVTPVFAQDNALLNGTIIISLISKDTIWLGADSRTSALTEKGYTVNKEGMCKIYSTDHVIYAMAGHVCYVDNSFNFLEIMRKCIDQQKDFERSMSLFEKRTKNEISSILKKFSKKSINTLIRTNNGSFLTVVAVTFADGEKKMKEMKFSIAEINNNNWNVIYKETDENGVGSLRFFGHASNASEYIRNNKLYFGNGKNIPNKIYDLIKLESTKDTITVGLPADVISIYDNGYKKVITSGFCEDQAIRSF